MINGIFKWSIKVVCVDLEYDMFAAMYSGREIVKCSTNKECESAKYLLDFPFKTESTIWY